MLVDKRHKNIPEDHKLCVEKTSDAICSVK